MVLVLLFPLNVKHEILYLAFCYMANTAGGELNFFALSYYGQLAVLAVAMKGYGYSAPFAAYFERPIDCYLSDLQKVNTL